MGMGIFGDGRPSMPRVGPPSMHASRGRASTSKQDSVNLLRPRRRGFTLRGMPVPPLVSGRLPLGRWPATPAEIEACFVTDKSQRRQKIWNDWIELTEAIRDAVGAVPAAWLGGSFFTDKDEPGDLDSVYIIEAHRFLAAKGADARKGQFLQVVASKRTKAVFGLEVDSFVLEWVARPGVQRAPWAQEYREMRGYWDDLWSRERSVDQRQDSLPRRGYVEVILDGYI